MERSGFTSHGLKLGIGGWSAPAAARSGETSAALVTFFGGMWMYLALAFGVLITFNVLIVLVGSVAARHAARHAEPRAKLRPKERERILTYVR